MSPIVKKKGEKFTLPSKYLLFVLTIICTAMIVITFTTNVFNGPLNYAVNYIIVPFQKGISAVGSYLTDRSDELAQIRDLINENTELKAQIAELTNENTRLMQDKYELNNLRQLYELDQTYESYNKIGARVIYRDSGNWFHSFIIDKGSNDGIEVDMNVLAGSGLVGRITTVGPDWSKITAIISDNAYVSGTVLSSSDNLIVSGNLELIGNGVIEFTQLIDSKDKVAEGDKIVTSDISDKFLPGILIGYISKINVDSNNLTKSGYLIPAVDFEHIEEVLVILDKKQSVTSE